MTEENLSRQIPDLKDALQRDGVATYYLGTIASPYLDDSANESRTAFDMPNESDLFSDGVTRKQIAEAAAQQVREYLKPHLEELADKKAEMARNVVATHAPELRSVVDRHPEILSRIAVDDTPAKVLAEISGQRYADRAEYRKLQAEILREVKGADRIDHHRKTLLERFTKETRQEAAITLSDFVIHRRAVLDVLDDLMGGDENDKFHREEAVHGIIFPMRSTSDEVPPDLANLWVIDDRLAFHHYLASDMRMDKLDPVEIESGTRPDVIVFHHAFAASDTPKHPDSITIIEFKRPGRDNYTFDENPYQQVLRYVNQILDGKMRDRQGRLITASRETRFSGYIAADFSASLVRHLERDGFAYGVETGTMSKYDPHLNLQVLAIDYKRMIQDAIRRNRAFFERLGMH